jgi:hypothetical protein
MSPNAHPARAGLAAVFAASLLLAVPAASPAATTIGQDLGGAGKPTKSLVCSSCTAVMRLEQPSPVSGVITRWRVATATFGDSVTLRVLRVESAFDGTSTGIATGAPQILSLPLNTFTSRLPIKAGETIGLNTGGDPQVVIENGAKGTITRISPILGDGETRGPGGFVNGNGALALNADVEPDADGDGFGDETQDGCPSDATRQGACTDPGGGGGSGGAGGAAPAGIADLTAPSASLSFKRRYALRPALGRKRALAGTVRSDEAGRVLAQAELAGRTAKRLGLQRSAKRTAIVANASASLSAASSTKVRFRFTRRAKRALRGRSRVTLTLRFTVRDEAGNPSVATRTVTLKR